MPLLLKRILIALPMAMVVGVLLLSCVKEPALIWAFVGIGGVLWLCWGIVQLGSGGWSE